MVLSSWACAQSKKLIEFGWDEPDTAYMRAHIATMEQTPFDGCVYHITYDKPDGTRADFLGECWGKRAFKRENFAGARADLDATKFNRFTSNFLRFDVTPGDVDWFDDFSPIVVNAHLAGMIAREGKSAGVLFDIEQYAFHLWDYSKQRHAKEKSFDDYAQQARQRGRQIMQAFEDGYPNLTVFLTFGYSLPHAEIGADKAKLATAEYGLLAPFLDGMFEAAKGKATIVDGFEISYGWKDEKEFDDGLATMKEKVLPLVGDREQYLKHLSAGFGLWMDYDWRKKGWNVEDPSKNYFTPEQFQASVKKALATSDEYVWVYTESPWWWKGDQAKSEKLPQAYIDAVRNAVKR